MTAASPKLPQELDRPLTIQTGSITQGTPVNSGASRSSYEPLLKVTPPGSDKGSITQGTPVYDKKHHLLAMQQEAANKNMAYDRASAEYYRRTGEASPASASAAAQAYYAGQQVRPVGYGNETHLSSRQVLMNDFAMARSTEMQRRPDSREHHPQSPGMMPSPRSRAMDPRSGSAQLEVVRQRTAADRFEPRAPPDARGDPKADLPNMQHRGDPRSGLQDPRSLDPRAVMDPRGDPRADLRIDLRRVAPTTIERGDPRMVIDPRMHLDARSVEMRNDPRIIDSRMDPRYVAASALAAAVANRPGGYHQPIYLSSDGRYVAQSMQQRDSRSMSPPRNTPPPRSMAATTIVQPRSVAAGNLTAGAKLGQREVEIYRTHPEVTISKTNSPRHGYNEHNPLSSLVDVAVQQAKLPDTKERQMQLHHQQQQQARAASQYDRAKYEMYGESHRQEQRYANPGMPGGSSSSDPRTAPLTASSQIVQQVRAERSKQLYLLQGDRVVTAERGYPISAGSAARITSAPSEMASKSSAAQGGHLPRPPSNGGRGGDVPAVILNERSGMGHPEARTVTAASLIDAIITHSINSGPPPDGGVSMPPKQFQYRRSPGAGADQGQDGGKASPYGKMSNGPMENDRSELPKTSLTMTDHMEHLISKDLSIQPASSGSGPGDMSAADLYWKRRSYPEQLRQASAVTTGAPRNAASLVHGDERQITRVAQVISPRHNSNPGVEAISPPNSVQHHGSPPGAGDPIARFLDAQKRQLQNSDGKGGHPPGLSPLDYVKNKIVEEMKKNEGSEYVKNKIAEEMKKVEAAAAAAGAKRSLSGEGALHPSSSNNGGDRDGESPRKKMRMETHENDMPDSPGSGEMVIDETARPDSVSSHKTASPAPSSNQNSSQLPATSYGMSSSTSTSIAGNASKYEPLSDDE